MHLSDLMYQDIPKGAYLYNHGCWLMDVSYAGNGFYRVVTAAYADGDEQREGCIIDAQVVCVEGEDEALAMDL